MRFQMQDGEVFVGRSYEGIVQRMSSMKLDEPRSLESYRKATAQRVLEGYGVEVPHSTNRAFVLGLVAAGLMKPVKGQQARQRRVR
jgi:hypothetical protein